MNPFWANFEGRLSGSGVNALVSLPVSPVSFRRCRFLCILFVCVFAALAQAQTRNLAGTGNFREVSVAEYRKHLETLDSLVTACQKQRSSCDPAQVGEDERVQGTMGAESREIRYGWLRLVLGRAAKAEEPISNEPAKSPMPSKTEKATALQPTVEMLLKLARERLAVDWKQAGGTGLPITQRNAERKELESILARREFQGVKKLNAKEQLMEKLSNWLNELFARLVGYSARSPWIAFALRGLLLAGILVGLGWGLLQLERRSRLRVVPELLSGSEAPSAREWQLWLKDAQAMAAQGAWREGIHFVYWASISLLESRRLWPADRARTAREYLALVPEEDPRKASLTALTASFERTWYGGRETDAEAYQRSLTLVSKLGVE